MLQPPAPTFCTNGTIIAKHNENTSCITGYECNTKIGKITTLEQYEAAVNYSCRTASDCEIKDVHNCCGYYPKCVNKDSFTDPSLVENLCQEQGMAGVCGFPEVNSCKCENKTCVAA